MQTHTHTNTRRIELSIREKSEGEIRISHQSEIIINVKNKFKKLYKITPQKHTIEAAKKMNCLRR